MIPREEQPCRRAEYGWARCVLASAVALGAGGDCRGGSDSCRDATEPFGHSDQGRRAVSLRVNDLNAAISKVNADSRLGSDNAALVAYLQADIAPLQALGQKIAGDTTESTAAADYATIFTNYRVLALVLPAAHIAGAADQIDVTTVPTLTALAAKAAVTRQPSQSGGAAAPHQRSERANRCGHQRHRRRFRHRVGLHAERVERQPRSPRFGTQLGSVRPQRHRQGTMPT